MERLPHSGTLHAAAWLPLIVLSIERLRAPSWRRWLVAGGVGAACCFLAGHPQPAIYIFVCALLYALASGRIARADRCTTFAWHPCSPWVPCSLRSRRCHL